VFTYSSALLSEYAPLCRSALLDVDDVEAADEGVAVVSAAVAVVFAAVDFLVFTTSALVALRSVLPDELELTAVAFCFLERAVVSDVVVVLCCC